DRLPVEVLAALLQRCQVRDDVEFGGPADLVCRHVGEVRRRRASRLALSAAGDRAPPPCSRDLGERTLDQQHLPGGCRIGGEQLALRLPAVVFCETTGEVPHLLFVPLPYPLRPQAFEPP